MYVQPKSFVAGTTCTWDHSKEDMGIRKCEQNKTRKRGVFTSRTMVAKSRKMSKCQILCENGN